MEKVGILVGYVGKVMSFRGVIIGFNIEVVRVFWSIECRVVSKNSNVANYMGTK